MTRTEQHRVAPPSAADPATINPDALLQIAFGFMASKVLFSALELNIFTLLGKGPLAGDALAAKTGLHPRSARDFLDTLVSMKLLERAGNSYSNTPISEVYLDRNRATYIGGLFEMADARLYPFWGRLSEALRTGKPQSEAKDADNAFNTLYADGERLESFLQAMTGISLAPAQAMAELFPWGSFRTVVDIGCAEGALLAQVARRHKHIKGYGYDLPVVQPLFQRYVHGQGVADRVHFRAGDFFRDEAFPTADVIVMGHILHDWNLEEKQLLLRKAYAALPAGGALIVYETLIDDERRENTPGLLMSLNMLIETPGGFDFTGRDCTEWMKAAGFHEVRVEPLSGTKGMVIGIK
jgi:SAM-dependent methyltransferase